MKPVPMQSVAAVVTLAIVALLLPVAVPAAQLAKSGEFSATYCFTGNYTSLVQAKDALAYSFDLTGPVRADTPGAFLDRTSVACVGFREIRGGASTGTHQCHFLDGDGDKLYARFAADGPTSTFELLGGTGKYAGISGSGKTRCLGRFPKIKEGTFQGCTHGGGRYELP